MQEHPDHHDAELMLRLYDLRREEKLRQAREWFAREFQAESLPDFLKRFPSGTEQNAYFRMVIGYWEMAASIVNHGLIKEAFFFESNTEFYGLWTKVKHLMGPAREAYKNPHLWANIETLSEKYEKWMAARAPEALASFRERLAQMQAKTPAK
ncbi:MAG: hypothetical protein ACLQOO_10890 [Terriglobia bacterium]